MDETIRMRLGDPHDVLEVLLGIKVARVESLIRNLHIDNLV